MSKPLVSVICLCYNQQQFVAEAIESVLRQTYEPIELIVVDDASTDNSVEAIKSVLVGYPHVKFLALKENVGNCKAFNRAAALAKGAYLIDLAADDVLLPARVATGVQVLSANGNAWGVHFSDASIIDETGVQLYVHSDRFPHNTIPVGDVYAEVVKRYFICPPTVMFTRSVLDVLGGYDETLSYEDFDFWVRSSRAFKYAYSPEVLVKRRVSPQALSGKQFRFFSKHSRSTLTVCEKILRLNNTNEERAALRKRILYETRLNLGLLNLVTAAKFMLLWIRNERMNH